MAFSPEVTTPLLREHQRRFWHLNFASTRPVFWAYTVLCHSAKTCTSRSVQHRVMFGNAGPFIRPPPMLSPRTRRLCESECWRRDGGHRRNARPRPARLWHKKPRTKRDENAPFRRDFRARSSAFLSAARVVPLEHEALRLRRSCPALS